MFKLCSLWMNENVKWDESNWDWDDCQLVADICAVWGTTAVLWINANWKWSECTGSAPTPPPTGSATGSANLPGVDATTLIQPWMQEEPWNPYKIREKRKKLIKLICKVKGEKYDSEKEVKDFDIAIEDVKLVVRTVANIDLDLRNEKINV